MFVHVRSMNLMFIMEFSDVWRQDLKTTRHQNVIKPWLTEVNEFNRTAPSYFLGWLITPHHTFKLEASEAFKYRFFTKIMHHNLWFIKLTSYSWQNCKEDLYHCTKWSPNLFRSCQKLCDVTTVHCDLSRFAYGYSFSTALVLQTVEQFVMHFPVIRTLLFNEKCSVTSASKMTISRFLANSIRNFRFSWQKKKQKFVLVLLLYKIQGTIDALNITPIYSSTK